MSGLTLTREQVRRFDRQAVEKWAVPAVVLMENAGRNITDAIERFFGGLRGRRLAVVAGGGNNGGDGFVIARHAAMRGAAVGVFLVGAVEKLPDAAAVNWRILERLAIGRQVVAGAALAGLGRRLDEWDIVVDALGGTGISGPLRGELAQAVEEVNASARPVVAVDIPTGLDCDSGRAEGPAVRAVLTVTMVARKAGFDQEASRACTGQVCVVDIGVPAPAEGASSPDG